MTRGRRAVPPDVVIGGSLPIAGREHDLQFIDLIPLGLGPLPVRNSEKLLQAMAGGSRLRFIHGVIISSFDKVGLVMSSHWRRASTGQWRYPAADGEKPFPPSPSHKPPRA
jgi:hypothetical protein